MAARTKDHWLVQTEKGLSESSARAVETESRGRDASTMGTGSLSLPLPACLKSTLLGNHRYWGWRELETWGPAGSEVNNQCSRNPAGKCTKWGQGGQGTRILPPA